MTFTSDFPDLDIPKVNVLDYLFPEGKSLSDEPVWLDAKNPKKLNLSPKRMLQLIKRICIGLDNLEINRGEVCLIYSPNHIYIPAAYLAIVGSGRCFSSVNPIYTVPEVVHQLKNTEAKCILVHPDLLDHAVKAAKEAGLSKDRIFLFNDEKCSPKDGVKDWSELLGDASKVDEYRWKSFTPEESVKTVATINYSSGTTGLPKGVCISHHALISNVEQTIYVRWYPGLKEGEKHGERWIGFLPLFHAYGQLYVNLMATKMLVPTYIMKQFVYTDFLQHIQDYKITHLQVAPPILVMMNKRAETSKYDLSSVKEVLCGAAPLARELQNAVARDFNVAIKQGWGMTEVTCGSIIQLEPSSDGSIGKLIPNTECKLIDEEGQEVGYDTPGEIHIRAPNVCLRYWKNEEATNEALSSDGWLKTGDVGVVNKEHLFYIVDRKKELIKVNGLQVAPAELESLLLENEDIADAAVVGITLNGEEFPRAYVTLQDEKKGKVKPKQIQDWVKERVAKYKQLVGGVTFVDEVPKLASGKIQRKLMRDWAKRDAPEVEKELGSNVRAKL